MSAFIPTSDDYFLTSDRAAIQDLYIRLCIVPQREGFQCKCLPSCSNAAQMPLITGTWAYVGTQYGQATINRRPTKILFIAMDRGGKGGPDKRADEEIFADAQCAFRQCADTPYNPHMRGVHLILRELVDDKDPSVFSRQYALTNAVKCARETGKMYTKVPRVMIHNCAGYLPKEIETLKPDLIITQGQHPAWTVTSSRYFECLKQKEKFMGERGRSAEVWTRENRCCIVLTTPHPARLKGLSWREKKLPEFLLNAIQYSKSLLQLGKSSM